MSTTSDMLWGLVSSNTEEQNSLVTFLLYIHRITTIINNKEFSIFLRDRKLKNISSLKVLSHKFY